MISESRHRRFMAEINVIPLVDVVLVLLVIFMVTAPMLYRGMDINLPKSATNTIKPEMRTVLTIEKDQRLYLDKDPIGVAQLEQKLKILKHEHADGVKKAGIEKIGMVTEPVGPERVGGSPIPRAPSRKS